MKTDFKKSFIRDLRNVKDSPLKKRLKSVIEQIEQAEAILEVISLEKLKGESNYYRIRICDYRVGLKYENDIMVFV